MENVPIIIASILTLSIIGAVSGALLAYAAEKFKVEYDPNIEAIFQVLPQTNCGACGYPGCRPLAEAISKGVVDANGCRVGGEKTTQAICKILGSTAKPHDPVSARLFCGGGNDICGKKFEYRGIRNCAAAMLVSGGDKLCDYGCLGYGDCVKTCKFDAMKMGDNGLPLIDPEKCVACGKCLSSCPRKLIKYVPKKAKVLVNCSSKDKGAMVRKVCKVGCIKCNLCEKNCPTKAIVFKDLLPVINYDVCEVKRKCVQVCPTKTIIDL